MGDIKLSISKRKSSQQQVVETLRRVILAGELPPGTHLNQSDLARRLSVSTTPLREALNELAAEGLVRIDPYRGVWVTQLSPQELRDIYEFRAMVETYCTKLTVERIREEELDHAEKLIEVMDGTTENVEWIYLNRQFHELLDEAIQSPHIAQVLALLRNITTLYISASFRMEPDRKRPSNAEHRAIIEACRERDADKASALVNAHMLSTVHLAEEEAIRQQKS